MMSEPARIWSPLFNSIVTACTAAIPEENARAALPDSSEASVASTFFRVGLPLRE